MHILTILLRFMLSFRRKRYKFVPIIPDSPQVIILELQFFIFLSESHCVGAGDGLQMCWPGTKQSSDQI